MEFRLNRLNIYYERPHISIARYSMIKHASRFKNPHRGALLKQAQKRYQTDGLYNVNYTLNSIVYYKLFIHVLIDVGNPPEYIIKLLNTVKIDRI